MQIDSYSLELEDEEGFAGDKANKAAFVEILDDLRKPLRESGEDPLGAKPSAKISRKKLASLLVDGKPEEVAVVQSAIEEFAQQLKGVICRFLKLKSWQGTEQIVAGGGFRDSRVGEIAIARTNLILRTEEIPTELQLLHADPDHAGLIGSAHLLPAWMLQGYDAILERIPRIDGHDTVVVIHNDAVIQGLSEIPHMQGRRHWGILTIGTGLGNARFSSRSNHKAKG